MKNSAQKKDEEVKIQKFYKFLAVIGRTPEPEDFILLAYWKTMFDCEPFYRKKNRQPAERLNKSTPDTIGCTNCYKDIQFSQGEVFFHGGGYVCKACIR